MSVESLYQQWLTEKLKNLEIDHEVYESYITSIIVSDEPEEEKKDSLRDILLGCTDVATDELCDEILKKWTDLNNKSASEKEEKESLDMALRVQLIMEKQAQVVSKATSRSTDEEKLREAILSSCRFVSDEEEEESDEGVSSNNQNVDAVLQAEKDKREKMKSESEKKKVQCKQSREKQKVKQEERKEKERKRTQKREHKR